MSLFRISLSAFLGFWAFTALQGQCAFTVSPSSNICPGQSVQFSVVNPQSDTLYQWDFNNDGVIDATGPSVAHSFPFQTFTVVYTVVLSIDSLPCASQNISVQGAPALEVVVQSPTGINQSGNNFSACSGVDTVVLEIYNISPPTPPALNYVINWGDNSPPQTYTPATFSQTTPATHTYGGLGYNTIIITANGANCSRTRTFNFYSGSNPSVGITNPGNTVGLCAPETISFPLLNTANNPEGTIYEIFISGELQQTYTQDNVPPAFAYTFTESSCGFSTTNGQFQNSFDVRIVASNPCGTSAATAEPIQLSSLPVPDFNIIPPPGNCPGSVFTFVNTSTEINEVFNQMCSSILPPFWSIQPGTLGVEWDIVGGTLFSQSISVQFNEIGVYAVTLTMNSSACGPGATTQNIVVQPPPVAAANAIFQSNPANCVPATVFFDNFSQGLGLGYLWSVQPLDVWGFSNGTEEDTPDPYITFYAPGTYTITLATTNICATDLWDTTIVFAGPPGVSLDPIPDFCETATLTLNAGTVTYSPNGESIASYFWSLPGGNPASSTQAFPGTVNYPDTGVFIVSATASNLCGSSIVQDTFAVIPPPVISLPAPFSLCLDADPVTLSASPSTGSWSGPGVVADVFYPSQAGDGDHALTYEVAVQGCDASEDLVVTVFPLPTVSVTAPAGACVNDPPIALQGTPANGTWSASNGGVIAGNEFDPAASGADTYTIYYQFTNAQGCTGADSASITVFPAPGVNAPDAVFCNVPGGVALPAATPAPGAWSGPGISNNLFDPALAGGVNVYNVTYSYTDNNGCTGQDDVTFEVIDFQQALVGPDTSLCQSAPALDLTPFASPAPGSWSLAGGGPGLNGSLFDPMLATEPVNVLQYTYGTGNCESSGQLSIEVFPLPMIDLGGNPTQFCEGDPAITLIASPVPGIWTGNGISGTQFDPAQAGSGPWALTYAFQDNNGCAASATLNVVVNEPPDIVVGDTTYCNNPGLVALPFANPAGGDWSGQGVDGNAFDPVGAGGMNTYTLTYIFEDANQCADTATIQVEVVEPEFIEAGPTDTLCIDQGILILTGFAPASGGTWSGPGITNASLGWFDPQMAGGGPHTLTFSYGAGNCLVADTKTVFVVDLESATAGPDESACLLDPPFALSGQAPADGLFSGPGIVNQLFDPQLAGVGGHIIEYEYVEAFSGCSITKTKTVTVHPMPVSAFTLPAEACIDQEIAFQNLSAIPLTPFWSFGDEIYSSEIEPVHEYSQTGTYTVTLVTTTAFGCQDSVSQELFITEPPEADFEPDLHEGCAVLEVNFENMSQGYEVSYVWTFGNGETSLVFQPGTVSFSQGLYDTAYIVSLTASNLCASVTVEDTITVFPLPLANFGITVDTGCTPHIVSFQNITLGNPVSFNWDMGNGFFWFDSLPPNQTYFTDTLPAVYNITLIAENFCGADTIVRQVVVNPVEVQAFFNAPNTQGCEPFEITFTSFATPGAFVYWDFGGIDTGLGATPTYVFDTSGVFKVIQYATNGCGYDSTFLFITVHPAPEVSFEAESFTCAGDSVFFVNTSVDVTGASWDFGNGDSSALNAPVYIYDQPGPYTVSLTALSLVNGCPATYTDDIFIRTLPVAAFSVSSLDGCQPLSVQFQNASIGATYYAWDFGDGNTAVSADTVFTFFSPGVYPVFLGVVDQFGCRHDTSLYSITVHPIPDADFDWTRSALCGVPVEAVFENQSAGAQDYTWLFGDGNSSTLNNPAHVFQDTGVFVIQLVATSTFLCRDTLEKSFKAYPIPFADMDILPASGCEPLEVSFQNLSELSNQHQWIFSDGDGSLQSDPVHVFQNDGWYGVTLVASYDGVCFDTLTLTNAIRVFPTPIANFNFEEITVPAPSGTFQFYNASSPDAQLFSWDFGDGGQSEEENPLHRFYANGEFLVTLTVTGANDCSDDTARIVRPSFIKGLFVPNTLSPEYGPPEVREFRPKGVGLREYRMQVFSGYGELIWESSRLEDGRPTEAWDGTLNGQLLPPDVYVWRASAIYEDETIWQGMPDRTGIPQRYGSILLIR